MAWFTRLSPFTLLTVALTLGLAINAPAQVQAQSRLSSLASRLENAFRAPDSIGVPIHTEGGGTRRPYDEYSNCIQGNETLVALVPAPLDPDAMPPESGAVGVGQTTAEYPTIYWYMPKTSASAIEFKLRDANEQEVYTVKYNLEKSAEGVTTTGIMSLTLPASAKLAPLEIGQEYQWELALKCDPVDSSADIVAYGGIKRVQADPNLAARVQRATPEEQVALYADKKLWYETLGTLVELQRDRPNDQTIADAWNKLLDSVGLNIVAEEPMFQGARPLTTTN